MLFIYISMLETDEERVRLSEIYEENEPYMLRYATVLLKDRYAAEDAVHNAFLSIIKNKEKYFSLSCRELRALCVIIVKSKCIDYLRHRNKIFFEQLEDKDPFIESSDVPIEEQVILSDEYALLRKHMKTLNEVSRIVLEMRYILGMTYKEIAQEFDTSPKHIDTIIQRAKSKLRKFAEAGGESDER